MKKIKLSDLPPDMTLRELAQVANAFGYELEPVVEPIEEAPEFPATCKGITRQGFRCSNKPRKGSAYCHAHQKLQEYADAQQKLEEK